MAVATVVFGSLLGTALLLAPAQTATAWAAGMVVLGALLTLTAIVTRFRSLCAH
ncbi:hypothetical protein [Nocardioides sp.]|uniref:hypothetical protein n=1 Tax=Nocardioides sp. TaxID=35761 RepID=UPI002ED33CD7